MKRRIFREGGPHQIRQTGPDQYTASVSLPTDSDGFIARECVEEDCSPGYFKVFPGTGITEDQDQAFCPYCRSMADPDEFLTEEQLRYGQDILLREASKGVGDMLRQALGTDRRGKRRIGGGLLSVDMTVKESLLPPVRRPLEEELRRDIVCQSCGLHHAVFGLAVWCPDCGADLFLDHVGKEIDVVAAVLGDVPRREEALGRRAAAKDLENCLEDAVSICEASVKAMVTRKLLRDLEPAPNAEDVLKRVGTTFQSTERTADFLQKHFGVALANSSHREILSAAFEKRHSIAHNLVSRPVCKFT